MDTQKMSASELINEVRTINEIREIVTRYGVPDARFLDFMLEIVPKMRKLKAGDLKE